MSPIFAKICISPNSTQKKLLVLLFSWKQRWLLGFSFLFPVNRQESPAGFVVRRSGTPLRLGAKIGRRHFSSPFDRTVTTGHSIITYDSLGRWLYFASLPGTYSRTTHAAIGTVRKVDLCGINTRDKNTQDKNRGEATRWG